MSGLERHGGKDFYATFLASTSQTCHSPFIPNLPLKQLPEQSLPDPYPLL